MISFLFTLFTCLLMQSAPEPTYFGLYMQRTDQVTSINSHQILIIGSLKDGEFSVVEDDHEPEDSDFSLSNRATIMKSHNRFVAFNRGQSIGTINIEQVSAENFDCSSLVIGQSPTMKPTKLLPHSAGAKGFSGGKDIDYSHSISIALETSLSVNCQQSRSVPLLNSISNKDSLILRDFAFGELRKRNPSLKVDSIRMSDIIPYSFSKNGRIHYVFTCFAETDSSIESLAVIATINSKGIRTELLIANTNESDSWGHGHEFLDAVDLDADGIPEFIFQVGYYEATGFEIYKYHQDCFKKVFDTIPWGC
jgi:hypothetical protein